jgi:hypothetical protein
MQDLIGKMPLTSKLLTGNGPASEEQPGADSP